MKPRNSMYRILARCKAAKHGKTEKATRRQENARVAKESAEQHKCTSRNIAKAWECMEQDY